MALARQADYDQLVREMISEGASVDEASAEAQEVFSGSGYDLSAIYVYRTEQEMKDKEQIDLKFKTLEDKSAYANYVNSYVAIKGLEKILSTQSHEAQGVLKLAESRKLLRSILNILAQTVGEAEDEEDDEDDEDADESRVEQKVTLLSFIATVLHKGKTAFLDYNAAIEVPEDTCVMLTKLLEEVSDEARIVEKLLDVLLLLSAHDNNRTMLAQAGLAAQVDLAVKMNKKSAPIAERATALAGRL